MPWSCYPPIHVCTPSLCVLLSSGGHQLRPQYSSSRRVLRHCASCPDWPWPPGSSSSPAAGGRHAVAATTGGGETEGVGDARSWW
jgi:hypothetical protein